MLHISGTVDSELIDLNDLWLCFKMFSQMLSKKGSWGFVCDGSWLEVIGASTIMKYEETDKTTFN